MAAMLTAAAFASEASYAQTRARHTIKLNVGTPTGHPYNVGADAFKRIVEEGSKGEVAVQVYPSAQLGGEVESAKNVQLGTLEATIVSTSNLSSFYGKLSVFSVPYVFRSVSCSFAVLDSAVGQEMTDALLKTARVRVLGYPTFGARHLFNTRRPVKTVEDLRGLKIRAPDRLLEATWRTLGANPTPLPFPEVFSALQQGVIDGDANPLASIQTFKWYESVKYVSFTNTAIGVGVMIISEPFFQRLPKNYQELVLRAGTESVKANRASEAEITKKAEQFLREQGVNFETPSQDEFKARLTPVFDDAKRQFGEELLARIAQAQSSGC
jgi:tripartite ATP-independent transporter DctP family solute receptor